MIFCIVWLSVVWPLLKFVKGFGARQCWVFWDMVTFHVYLKIILIPNWIWTKMFHEEQEFGLDYM